MQKFKKTRRGTRNKDAKKKSTQKWVEAGGLKKRLEVSIGKTGKWQTCYGNLLIMIELPCSGGNHSRLPRAIRPVDIQARQQKVEEGNEKEISWPYTVPTT
jgi:hypothetical protein